MAAGHIDKTYLAWNPELAKYLAAFQKAEAHFRGIAVTGVPRATRADVDTLAKMAAANSLMPPHVLYEVLRSPAVQAEPRNPAPDGEGRDNQRGAQLKIVDCGYLRWADGAILRCGASAPPPARKRLRVDQGHLIQDGVCTPLFRCISRSQGAELLKNIREGHCCTHLAPSALADKTLSAGPILAHNRGR